MALVADRMSIRSGHRAGKYDLSAGVGRLLCYEGVNGSEGPRILGSVIKIQESTGYCYLVMREPGSTQYQSWAGRDGRSTKNFEGDALPGFSRQGRDIPTFIQ
jgi:hypothetical protein